jgi:hypothetical protein
LVLLALGSFLLLPFGDATLPMRTSSPGASSSFVASVILEMFNHPEERSRQRACSPPFRPLKVLSPLTLPPLLLLLLLLLLLSLSDFLLSRADREPVPLLLPTLISLLQNPQTPKAGPTLTPPSASDLRPETSQRILKVVSNRFLGL